MSIMPEGTKLDPTCPKMRKAMAALVDTLKANNATTPPAMLAFLMGGKPKTK
jgi:hypothetical protein